MPCASCAALMLTHCLCASPAYAPFSPRHAVDELAARGDADAAMRDDADGAPCHERYERRAVSRACLMFALRHGCLFDADAKRRACVRCRLMRSPFSVCRLLCCRALRFDMRRV